MCLPLNGLVSPSWIIASIALPSPMRKPKRAWGACTGALDIDSMPPPTPTSTSPARIAWSSIPTARMPDAQTLLMVSRGDLLAGCRPRSGPGGTGSAPGRPAARCPSRRGRRRSPSTPARSSAALMAMPPSSVAFSEESPPPSFPTGVRAALRITVLGMGGTVACARCCESASAEPADDVDVAVDDRGPRRRRRASAASSSAAPGATAGGLDASGSATRASTPSARGSSPPKVIERAGELGCASLRLGRARSRRRSSRAPSSPPTATTPTSRERRGRRRPRDAARRATGARGARSCAEAQNAARDLVNAPGQRADADASWPPARASWPPSSASSARCSAASRSATPGWAPSPPSRRAPTRSRS